MQTDDLFPPFTPINRDIPHAELHLQDIDFPLYEMLVSRLEQTFGTNFAYTGTVQPDNHAPFVSLHLYGVDLDILDAYTYRLEQLQPPVHYELVWHPFLEVHIRQALDSTLEVFF